MIAHLRSCHARAAVLLLAGMVAAQAQQTRVLPVAEAVRTGPGEFRIAVTFHNCGAAFERDYAVFIHFDRSEHESRLLTCDAPGPRPMVARPTTSQWGPNAVETFQFGPVVIPPQERKPIFIKAGMYDPDRGGDRLRLIGADGTGRVPLGRLVRGDEGWAFERMPPASGSPVSAIGVRPRGLVRGMPDRPAVRFGEADLGQWRLECHAGAQADMERTRAALCWSESSLQITYRGKDRASRFVLRPHEPIPVPADAEVARLWLMGRACGWRKNRTSEQPLLWHDLDLRDAAGAAHRVRFPRTIGYPFWYVARVRLPTHWPRPLHCTGLGFTGCTNTRPLSLVLDALVFAKESLARELHADVRLDDLPFPTDPDGLLPSPPAGPFTNRVEPTEDGCRLTYDGPDGRLAYHYRPATGGLDDVRVHWPGRPEPLAFAAGGGPVIEAAGRRGYPGDPHLVTTRLAFEVRGDRVHTVWRCAVGDAAVEYALDLSIRGKSLLVEVDAAGEGLVGFHPGQLVGVDAARFVDFPYWTWLAWDWGRDGGVAVVDGRFLSGYPDWYRSRASQLTFGPPVVSHQPEALLEGAVSFCPGVVYERRSDGRRARLRERFIFTVSRRVEETLPSIPHPPSPNRERLAPFVHSTGGQASRLESQLEHWTRLHAYGVNQVYIRHFDGMWSDVPQGPQEWTLTEHAAPLVGDAAVRRYLDSLRAMGFLPVLYTNYTDLQPVAAEFDWDKVCLLPDGDISSLCWPGSYPLKPLRGLELEAKYAPAIAKRFGSQGSFCDVHTAVAPWRKVDYDARLPGAGQFGTTYRCYGKLLLNERAQYGAVYSEGSIHWLYAGLHDGSDGQMRGQRPWRNPFLVDFDLLKVHPKQMDAGMSWLSRYVTTREATAALGGAEAAQDRFTAATIAFGHQGAFTGQRFRGGLTDVKTYYMVQPLQMRYAMREADAIRYRDPKTGQMLDTSDAIRSGAYLESQVYVRYETGLAVRVNGSLTEDWTVTVDGSTYALPASGFVCTAPDVLVFSAMVGGGRMDYRRTPGVRFVDARGRKRRVGEIETDGAAILRKEGAAWRVWPLGNVSVLKVHLEALGLPRPRAIVAQDEAGAAIAKSAATMDEGWLALPIGDAAFRYEIAAGEGK